MSKFGVQVVLTYKWRNGMEKLSERREMIINSNGEHIV